jgi:diguanylate cyclase (GGDEF)-like protein/PAS domain S-box-containing protein
MTLPASLPRTRRCLVEWGFLLAILLIFGSYIAYSRYQEYLQIDVQERERLSSQTAVIEKNLVPQIASVSKALESVREDLPRWQEQKDGLLRTNRRLQVFGATLPGVRTLLAISADGRVAASNNETLIGASLAHREWFQVAARNNTPQTLYVIEPIKSLLNTYVIALARSVSGPNGEFAGVIYASLHPDFAGTLLDSVRYASDARSFLIHGDGKLFMTMPERPDLVAKDLAVPNSLFSRHRDSGRMTSIFAETTYVTNEERMAAFRTVRPADLSMDKSLVVVVSRDLRGIFAPWRRNVAIQGGMFGLLAVIACLSLYFYQRRQRILDLIAVEQEQLLRDSEERLNEAQRISQVGSWTLDLKTGRLVWSDEVFRLFEIDPNQFSANYEAFLNAIHPQDREAVNQAYTSSLESRAPYEITHRLLMSDGRIKWVHERCTSDFDASGKPLRSQGTVQDVTRSKLADDDLRIAASAFESHQGMVVTDASDVIIRINRAFTEITGYSAEEAVGQHMNFLKSDRHDADFYATMWRDITECGAWQGEIWNRHRNEKIYAHWLTITAVKGACGATTHYVGTYTDMTERKRAEEALQESFDALHSVLVTTPDGYWCVDCEGRLLDVNPAYCRQSGYARDELLGMRIVDLEAKESAAETAAHIQRIIESGSDQFESLHRRKDGTHWHVEISVTYREVGGGQFFVFVRDIDDRWQAENDLRIAAAAFDSQECMMITDANNVILKVNQAFVETTGYTANEVVGRTPSLLKSGRHNAGFYRTMWETINTTGGWQGEVWDRRKNGEEYPKWLTISAVKSDAGVVTHYIGAHFDITERKVAEDRINELAYFDQLTHLPNRTLLLDRLKQAMTTSDRSGSYSALLFIDLDNFKKLNDTLGHEVGDLLLKQVAQRLTQCVREGDTVARLGGDEFVVILTNLGKAEMDAANGTETVAQKILTSLNQIYRFGELGHHSTASIGATLFNGHPISIDNLMKQADLTMYKAKEAGRNTVRFFDPAMEVTVKARAALESDLRQAVEAKDFVLHYQAQIAGGWVTGAEVLVRWKHAKRGMVSPAEFIPLAEETGLILPLGHWVLETACTQLAAWAAQPEMAHFTLAVNVSAPQFRESDFVDRVLAVLKNTGTNPYRLKLELTESMLADNVEDIIEKMFALKAKGVGFSLDDFGTGYSSLSYLKRLPLDQLKIDQSFVRDVMVDANDAAIAKTVIALAQSLGLGVIAEGVETEVQKDFLASSGCHAYQGYFFSRPLAVEAFERFVQGMVCLA